MPNVIKAIVSEKYNKCVNWSIRDKQILSQQKQEQIWTHILIHIPRIQFYIYNITPNYLW